MKTNEQPQTDIAELEQQIAALTAREDVESVKKRLIFKFQLGELHYLRFSQLENVDPFLAVQNLYEAASLGYLPAFKIIFAPSDTGPSTLSITLPEVPSPTLENESPEKLFFLGLQAFYGIGQAVNAPQAANYFWHAAVKNHAGAQDRLALCYFKGWGVKQNKAQAVQWWTSAADLGHPNSMLNLNRTYLSKQQNPQKAMKMLVLAANKDHPRALAILCNELLKDKNMPQNPEKGLALLMTLARDLGYDLAQLVLGTRYLRDIHTSQDKNATQQKAIYWLALAADQGSLSAHSNLAQLYGHMASTQTTDFALKQELFTKSLRHHVASADGDVSLQHILDTLKKYSDPILSKYFFIRLIRSVFSSGTIEPCLPHEALFNLCGFLTSFSGSAYELQLLTILRPLFEKITENAAEQLKKYWPTVRSLNDQAWIQVVRSQHAQIIKLQRQVRALQQSQMTSTVNLSVVEDEKPEEEPRVKKRSHSDEEEIEAAINAENTNDQLQDQFRFVGKPAKKSRITTPPEDMPQNSDDFELKGSSLD